MTTQFQADKCYEFDKLIAFSNKDDKTKETWLAQIRDLDLDTDFDKVLGSWTYEMVWNGAKVNHGKMTPFSFKQYCSKLHCPPNFMKKLPGNIAKQNLDFFKSDVKEEELMLKVRKHEEGFHYVRGMIKPSNPVINNTDLLSCIRDEVVKRDMRVWKAHFRDEDFHAKLIYGKEINIGSVQSPDNVNVGIHIANSEVGARPTEIYTMVFRLVCTNGLISMVDGVPLFRKATFNATRDELLKEVECSMSRLDREGDTIIGMFQDAAKETLNAPYKVISAISKNWKMQKSHVVAVVEEFNRQLSTGECQKNKIGIVNAFTKTAQSYDPETRSLLENIAGQVLVDVDFCKKSDEVLVSK